MSLDPRLVELIHARIDGVISDAENVELEALFDRDPTARSRFDELQKVAGMLDDVERVAPPAGLRAGILEAVRPPAAVKTPGRRTGRKRTCGACAAPRAD